MASEKQIAANRRNGLKSTGPRTARGKEISSQNALTHGLTAIQVVLEGEDVDAFEALRQDLKKEFQPSGASESQLVEQLAGLLWRLRRVPVFEAAMLTWIAHCQAKTHDKGLVTIGRVLISADRRSLPVDVAGLRRTLAKDKRLLGRTLEVVLGQRDMLNKIGRYESQLRGQVGKILAELTRKKSRSSR